jgi:FlaA1/EpsC-like NDP-sugar epimerase
MPAMGENRDWQGKRVLVTGACGTVGRELLAQLTGKGCAMIVGLDNNETELFMLAETYSGTPNVRLILGDVRDRERLMREMRGIDIVLHAGALKHVILCEESPHDAALTNVQGVINVIDAAEASGVQRLLFTSSDKAVNPTSVMGTTKLMGERLISAANVNRRAHGDTISASTRFGNVLGSRGSVIPLFMQQIAQGGPVTVTDPGMTRFIMSIRHAAELVLESVFLARGGEVFVTKMPVVRISDLAEVMIELLAPRYRKRASQIETQIIGVKPGEKMYEELMNDEEVRRTLELERFFCVLPAFKNVYQTIHYDYAVVRGRAEQAYNSATERPMTKGELAEFLTRNRILEEAA